MIYEDTHATLGLLMNLDKKCERTAALFLKMEEKGAIFIDKGNLP